MSLWSALCNLFLSPWFLLRDASLTILPVLRSLSLTALVILILIGVVPHQVYVFLFVTVPLFLFSYLLWIVLGVLIAGGIYLFHFRRQAVLATYRHLVIRLICAEEIIKNDKYFRVEHFRRTDINGNKVYVKNIEITIPPRASDQSKADYNLQGRQRVNARIEYWKSQIKTEGGSVVVTTPVIQNAPAQQQ
jgi:hypothetical protein